MISKVFHCFRKVNLLLIVVLNLSFNCNVCIGQFIDDRTCARWVENLNVGAAFYCKCSTTSRPFGGINVFVECVSPDGEANFCFGSQFCGTTSFNLTRAFPGGTRNKGICMRDVSLDPNDPVYILPNFCVYAEDCSYGACRRCSVDVEGQTCSCTVCDGGRAYTIDCVNGPYIECFGLNPFVNEHKRRKSAAPWTYYPVKSPAGGVVQAPAPAPMFVPPPTTPAPVI